MKSAFWNGLFPLVATLLVNLTYIEISYAEKGQFTEASREFTTSFENETDFSLFYISPQAHLSTSFHEKSDDYAVTGNYSHKAWVTGKNPPSTRFSNNNHRAYPAIQLYKTEGGSFETPVLITLWVWLNIELIENGNGHEDDWFSFATFTDDESDSWSRTVLVNLSHDGFVHLQHTVAQGESERIFQNTSLEYPMREWVELSVYLDFSNNGYAKVWQNGQLVSHAEIGNIENRLAQAHFGMYSSPQVDSGVVYNDDLRIKMVDGE